MLADTILKDYQEAMKAKDAVTSTLLSSLRAEIANAALRQKDKLDDNSVIAVIRRQIKQHQDSIEQFTQGGRNDLAEKETKELAILERYLPAQLSADAVKKVIEEVIAAVGAQGPKDMGKVMKEVMAKTGPAADNKLVSDLVRQRLAPPSANLPPQG